MNSRKQSETVSAQAYTLTSFSYDADYLDRLVRIDVYAPEGFSGLEPVQLLLVNDGQDLLKMPFLDILNQWEAGSALEQLLVVAIHCGAERRLEYGTADVLDYASRGSRARYYRKFVMKELLPLIYTRYQLQNVISTGFAGFSLGGLSALDIAWKHPDVFNIVGVFSGSLWWRSRSLADVEYTDEKHRIMHKLIRDGEYVPGMRFFFQAGLMDETMDRNKNGIIDSVDDTLDLIAELETLGYTQPGNLQYLELPEGRHDVPTWALAFPAFLNWGYGSKPDKPAKL